MRLDDLTILIPVRDDRRVVRCIASMDVDCPVLLVLNGASPEFQAWVRVACPRAQLVVTPRAGLGHAYNLGLEACRTEYALLMDSDCVFQPGTIEKLRRGLESAVLSKGRTVFSRSRGPISGAIAAYRTFHTSDHLSAFSPPLALSRAALKLLLGHYFDEDLAWSEDLDFDRRVKARGIRIAHSPDAVIVHPPLTLLQDLRSAYRYGTGYAMGERKGVFPAPQRRSWRDRLRTDSRHFRLVRSAKGTAASLYAMLWMQAYRLGFRSERRG